MNAQCLWQWVVVVLLAPTWVGAQEIPGRHAVRSELLGCWTLLDGRGLPAHHVLGSWVPSLVLLASDADRSYWIEDFPTARRAVRLDSLGRDQDANPPQSRWLASLWTADSLTDSVRLKFGNGRTGIWFHLAVPAGPTRDTLIGTAEERSDVAASRPRSVPARAVRTRCP